MLCHAEVVARPLLLVVLVTIVTLAVAATAGCGASPPGTAPTGTAAPGSPTSAAPAPPVAPPPEPGWVVGARELPLRPDDFGAVLATPEVLAVRDLPTRDMLPPPVSGDYESTSAPVPDDVLARSTWQPACPVAAEELRYLTMSFVGFDRRPHTGEMIVHADVARDVVSVFEQLFSAGFPIEEMRVVAAPELDAPPTGDGNNTTAFVCRPTVGQSRWSAHAYGLAIDVNPFHNPYQRDDLVLPELASAYLDRSWQRPGMLLDGRPAVSAFEEIGWLWGSRWTRPLDIMHFSATGD
ncbi:MAG: M15 family peptidase [Pseudonocardiaceae bacterium]|nr:M15 family peptidase [Pseudonocardiaceae bacterium]